MNVAIHTLAILTSAALLVAGAPSQAQAADNQQNSKPTEQTYRKDMPHRDLVPQGAASRMKRNGMKMAAPKVQSGDRRPESRGTDTSSVGRNEPAPTKR